MGYALLRVRVTAKSILLVICSLVCASSSELSLILLLKRDYELETNPFFGYDSQRTFQLFVLTTHGTEALVEYLVRSSRL